MQQAIVSNITVYEDLWSQIAKHKQNIGLFCDSPNVLSVPEKHNNMFNTELCINVSYHLLI